MENNEKDATFQIGDRVKILKYKNKIKVALDLSNYQTKSDLKKRNKCWYIKFLSKGWFT